VLHLTGDYLPRPLIHSPGKASYVARYPLEFVTGDITDFTSAQRTVDGCAYVVHLARGSDAVMLKGLENLLKASVAAKVKRFVHASSVAVYGANPPEAARYESAPTRKTGNDYGDLKLQQEELVAHYGKRFGLPFVILRPPFIVGPRSHFVEALTRGLQEHRIPIVGDGANVCNKVYVDNFIEAILLAIEKEEAVGETFFITDKEQTTWQRYLEDFGTMIGVAVPHATRDQLAAPPVLSSREALGKIARALLSDEPRSALMHLPFISTVARTVHRGYGSLSPKQRQFIRSKLASASVSSHRSSGARRYDATDYLISAQQRTVAHSCEKAERILGYTSCVSYATAMTRTREWMQFMRVISPESSVRAHQHVVASR
jgi:2-alkyl-3-oxoalkanoate reductase